MSRPRLAFTNRWMFGRVMLDESVCRQFIRCVLGIDVDRIDYLNAEQVLEPAVESRGVRMDVYAREGNRVYDTEMQCAPEPLLGRRFRYYQATLDMTTLAPGKDYDELCESFIVFLCTHDPFDLNLPVYTLERRCSEVSDLSIDCNSHWIALNAQAWDTLPDGVLRDLLHYTQNGCIGASSLVQRIDEIVAKANNDRKWVDKVFYCVSTIEENDARRARILERLARKKGLEEGREEGREQGLAEGRAEGRAEGAKEAEARYSFLVEHLLAEGRLDDLRMATSDEARRTALFEEFGL